MAPRGGPCILIFYNFFIENNFFLFFFWKNDSNLLKFGPFVQVNIFGKTEQIFFLYLHIWIHLVKASILAYSLITKNKISYNLDFCVTLL